MSVLIIVSAIIGVGILTLFVFAPLEPIDDEIANALKYDQNQEKMRKALGL